MDGACRDSADRTSQKSLWMAVSLGHNRVATPQIALRNSADLGRVSPLPFLVRRDRGGIGPPRHPSGGHRRSSRRRPSGGSGPSATRRHDSSIGGRNGHGLGYTAPEGRGRGHRGANEKPGRGPPPARGGGQNVPPPPPLQGERPRGGNRLPRLTG